MLLHVNEQCNWTGFGVFCSSNWWCKSCNFARDCKQSCNAGCLHGLLAARPSKMCSVQACCITMCAFRPNCPCKKYSQKTCARSLREFVQNLPCSTEFVLDFFQFLLFRATAAQPCKYPTHKTTNATLIFFLIKQFFIFSHS